MGNDEIVFGEQFGLKYLQFKKLLELGINHFYTLKSDGFDFATGGNLEKNSYETIAKILNLPIENLIIPKQAHTDCVKCVDEKTIMDDLKFTDGVITDRKNIALCTKNADCILFNFYDPVKKVIANIHSGWRGTFKKISEKTVIKMNNNYGCNPKDIYCFINPSIRVDHFEVDDDVAELGKEIFKFKKNVTRFIKKGRIIDNKQKYNIDSILINRLLLENIGLKSANIIDCEICSVCNKEVIASARGDGQGYTRAVSVVVI